MKRIIYIIPVIFIAFLATHNAARGQSDLGEICYNCHEEPGGHNAHYPGRKPTFDIPGKFKLGAKGSLQCTTCHIMPGEQQVEQLFEEGSHEFTRWLVVDGTNAVICGECHKTPRDWDGTHGNTYGHAVYDIATDDERAAKLISAGGRLGEDGMVICRTCHAAHGGVTPKMNVLETRDSSLCLGCHPDRETYINGKLTNHPLGERARRVTDDFEREALFGPNNTVACITCHKPHGSPTDWAFLIREIKNGDLCISCHTDKRRLPNGPHGEEKACLNCHAVHDAPSGKKLFKWKSEGKGKVNREMGVCIKCHSYDGKASPRVISYYHSHPMDVRVRDPEQDFNRVIVSCSACHDVHRGPSSPGGWVSYIKLYNGDGGICTACHNYNKQIVDTPHAVEAGQVMCRQCHSMHRPKIKDDLWKRSLPKIEGALPQHRECLGCHGPGGLASDRVPKYFIHPYEVEAMEVGTSKFYTAEGKRAKEGEEAHIVCQTCHNPHAAVEFFLRPNEELIEFCSMCHDDEAEKRYRTFHTDEMRESTK